MTRIGIAKILALYTLAGAGLGVVLVILVGRMQGGASTPDFATVSAQDLKLFLAVWLIATIPAGVAAALLVLNMIAFPLVRERRLVRSVLAAVIALFVSALFFDLMTEGAHGVRRLSQLARYGLIGAIPAALIAYIFPRGSVPMPSNNSFERTREE